MTVTSKNIEEISCSTRFKMISILKYDKISKYIFDLHLQRDDKINVVAIP